MVLPLLLFTDLSQVYKIYTSYASETALNAYWKWMTLTYFLTYFNAIYFPYYGVK